MASTTAEKVALAAQAGDPLALTVFKTVAKYLGRDLAILIDVLNPQRIVIGSIYLRQRALLEPLTLQVLQNEALPLSLSARLCPPGWVNRSATMPAPPWRWRRHWRHVHVLHSEEAGKDLI